VRAPLRLSSRALCAVCLALLPCAAFVGCGGSSDGDEADVFGIVADDSTLLGLSGATVSVAGVPAEPTDAYGAFILLRAPGGTRTITVVRNEYQTASTEVPLAAGDNDLGTLYIRPMAVPGLAHVSGGVRDSGTAVAGAQVTVGGKTAFTKTDGTFALYNLSPGSVDVQARSGAKSGSANVTLSSGMTTSVSISVSVRPPDPPII